MFWHFLFSAGTGSTSELQPAANMGIGNVIIVLVAVVR